jgi:hypothetical protein
MENLKLTVNRGGLGDAICALPVVSYMLQQNRGQIFIYENNSSSRPPENSLILCSELRDRVIIRPYNNMPEDADAIIVKPISEDFSFRYYHLVENSFRSVYGDTVDIKYKNYVRYNGIKSPNYDFINKEHVIINISYVANNRKIQDLLLEKIVNLIIREGLIPVFVGTGMWYAKNQIEFNNIYRTAGLDLTNKTTLLDLLHMLSKARLLISADSGTVHLAGMTDIPIFCVYTTADPLLRLPIRNNILGYKCEYVVPKHPCFCNTGKFTFPILVKRLKYNCVDTINHEESLEKIKRLLK